MKQKIKHHKNLHFERFQGCVWNLDVIDLKIGETFIYNPLVVNKHPIKLQSGIKKANDFEDFVNWYWKSDYNYKIGNKKGIDVYPYACKQNALSVPFLYIPSNGEKHSLNHIFGFSSVFTENVVYCKEVVKIKTKLRTLVLKTSKDYDDFYKKFKQNVKYKHMLLDYDIEKQEKDEMLTVDFQKVINSFDVIEFLHFEQRNQEKTFLDFYV